VKGYQESDQRMVIHDKPIVSVVTSGCVKRMREAQRAQRFEIAVVERTLPVSTTPPSTSSLRLDGDISIVIFTPTQWQKGDDSRIEVFCPGVCNIERTVIQSRVIEEGHAPCLDRV
jgi:hypothetical protein